MRKVGSWFADFPFVVTSALIVLVATHFALAQRLPAINVALALALSDVSEPRETLMGLALGVASVSALVGGFAGVVVIFGLGAEHDRFRLLRRGAGARLRASWVSVVLSSFAGAFGSVVSAVIVVAFGAEPAMWLLELCLLVAAHGAVRLTALLAGLARIVDEGDRDADREARTHSSEDLIADKSGQQG